MKDIEFSYIFTLIMSLLSGVITYFINRHKISIKIKSLQENNKHEIEKLMQQHKMDIDNLSQKHVFEIEKMELAHKQAITMKEKEIQGALGKELMPMIAQALLNHPATKGQLRKIITQK